MGVEVAVGAGVWVGAGVAVGSGVSVGAGVNVGRGEGVGAAAVWLAKVLAAAAVAVALRVCWEGPQAAKSPAANDDNIHKRDFLDLIKVCIVFPHSAHWV